MSSRFTFEALAALARRALPFLLIGGGSLAALALLYSLIAPNVYEATARVEVLPAKQSITANPDEQRQLTEINPAQIDAQAQILQTPAVVREVVRRAKLQRDPEFGGGSEAKAARHFKNALQVRRVAETALIDISVDSQSPERSERLANLTAAVYIDLERQRQRAETERTNMLLRTRVQEMAGAVRSAEAQVQAYRANNGLMSTNGATLAEQGAAELSQSLANARAQERAAYAELAQTNAGGAPLDTANTQSSLAALRARQAEARQAMGEAESRYGPRHPAYVAARESLQEIDRAVAEETTRARAAVSASQGQRITDLRARAAAATNLRRSLESSAGASAAGLARNSRAETQLADLERQAAALRSTYETYLNRYQQTLSQLGTEQPVARLVSSAVEPLEPISPNLKFNVVVGFVLGALIGLAAVTALMLFESHFTTAEQIERELDVEALPPLPTARSGELVTEHADHSSTDIAELMRAHPQSAFSESFKALAAALDRPVDGRANQVLALASALPGEGKTTASICLAQAIAWTGRRVLLIDADMRKHAVSRALASEASSGLGEVLADTADWRTAIVPGPVEGLDLLPNLGKREHVDAINTARLADLVAEWRQSYDIVLFDTAPVLPIADTRVLARFVDSVVVICRWRKTPRRAVVFALDLLGRADAAIAGVALSNVNLTAQAKYGLGDPSFYYRSYRSYFETT